MFGESGLLDGIQGGDGREVGSFYFGYCCQETCETRSCDEEWWTLVVDVKDLTLDLVMIVWGLGYISIPTA